MLLRIAAAINTTDIQNNQIGEREIPLKAAQVCCFDAHGSGDTMTAFTYRERSKCRREGDSFVEMLPFHTSAGRGEQNIAILFLLCL